MVVTIQLLLYKYSVMSSSMSWTQWIVHGVLRLLIKGTLATEASTDNFLRKKAKKSPYDFPKKFQNFFSVSLLPDAKCRTHVVSSKTEMESDSGIVIFYYHGGGYVANVTDEHISGITTILKLVEEKCTAIIPEYPLAPNFTHEKIFDDVEAVYRQVVSQRGASKIVLLGDSAGGGMALILAQRLAAAKKNGETVRQPDSVILLSPWLDVSMENPEVEKLSVCDPVLDLYGLKRFGALLSAGPQPISTRDPKVSPLFGCLEDLPPVSVWTSTHDLLSPDSRELQSRFSKESIPTPFRFVVEKFLAHDWWMFGGCDATRTIQQVAAAIREDCGLKDDTNT